MLLQVPFAFDFMIFFIFIWLFVIILIIASTIFWIMMLVDCAKRDFKDKLVWILIILFAGAIGSILYYYIVKKSEDKKK